MITGKDWKLGFDMDFPCILWVEAEHFTYFPEITMVLFSFYKALICLSDLHSMHFLCSYYLSLYQRCLGKKNEAQVSKESELS